MRRVTKSLKFRRSEVSGRAGLKRRVPQSLSECFKKVTPRELCGYSETGKKASDAMDRAREVLLLYLLLVLTVKTLAKVTTSAVWVIRDLRPKLMLKREIWGSGQPGT